MNDKKIYQMIGLCQRARLLVTGEFAVKQAVLGEKAHLVIVTTDASENTKKLFRDKSAYRNIKCIEWGNRAAMSQILGKEQRVAVAILDEKFAKKIDSLIENDG
ncbi:MAG: L7Ae/L30e/S12e/Gadd45 family ribosomal protein [Cellulosilyticaceae bacterium]